MTFTRENGGAAALELAETQAGVPYVFGGTTWNVGLDCSGLVQQTWARLGVVLPRTSEEQCSVAQIPTGSAYEVGDGVFFRGALSELSPGHVGLYVGVGTISADQHSWTPSTQGQHIFFNAPYTDDPHGIRYDYFDPATLLFLTRPANLLPEGPPTPPVPTPGEDLVDDLFITANPVGSKKGDYFCAWSTRQAVGIPSIAIEQQLEAQGAKRNNIDAATFAYFKTSNWKA